MPGLFLYSIIISAILVGKVVSPSTQAHPANNTPLCDWDKEEEKRTGKNTGNKCPGILLFTGAMLSQLHKLRELAGAAI